MRVTLVFESMFGNTETLANAVADGLRGRGSEVTVLRAGDPHDHDLRGVDLLVLGAPTHALSLSRPRTRADAVRLGAEAADGTSGVREWLAAVAQAPDAVAHPPVAVFDSRVRRARHWPGSAGHRTARSLRSSGFDVVEHTTFYVGGVSGPLLEGELGRAKDWGHVLAGLVDRPEAPHPA